VAIPSVCQIPPVNIKRFKFVVHRQLFCRAPSKWELARDIHTNKRVYCKATSRADLREAGKRLLLFQSRPATGGKFQGVRGVRLPLSRPVHRQDGDMIRLILSRAPNDRGVAKTLAKATGRCCGSTSATPASSPLSTTMIGPTTELKGGFATRHLKTCCRVLSRSDRSGHRPFAFAFSAP